MVWQGDGSGGDAIGEATRGITPLSMITYVDKRRCGNELDSIGSGSALMELWGATCMYHMVVFEPYGGMSGVQV